ncbi:MAG: hypothetical protein R2932_50905 [Caldilineaceae bacterium]
MATLLGEPLPAELQVVQLADAKPWLEFVKPTQSPLASTAEPIIDLDAQALVRNQLIVLDEATPSFETVAHEVVHLLQLNNALPAR